VTGEQSRLLKVGVTLIDPAPAFAFPNASSSLSFQTLAQRADSTPACPSPAAAIERAQGLWKVLGHTGAVAFSRTGDPATGDFRDATVLRKFGDVPDDLSAL
jgi:hypothetical protein